MMVYIAADQPLELVEWTVERPSFHVSRPHSERAHVARQFSKPEVFYLGSHEGCGCGFQYCQYDPENYSGEELAQGKRSRDDLASYLHRELRRVGVLELFACWDGDEEKPVEHRRTLSPSLFQRDDFFFIEKELSLVVEDAG